MPEGRAGRSNEGRDLAAQLVMREQLKARPGRPLALTAPRLAAVRQWGPDEVNPFHREVRAHDQFRAHISDGWLSVWRKI